MSEFQYYEFLAVDRPLTDADRKAMRAISSRARITATSLVNTYEWGDFKGDPVKLMERCFDLHLYWANWGTHRLAVRLPARLLDRALLARCMGDGDAIRLHEAGANVVLDIWSQDDEGGGNEDWEQDWYDDGVVMQTLAPLRAGLLGGDLRLYYLVWLLGVTWGVFGPEDAEPLPGLGPMDAAVLAFGRFFEVDADLMHAAADRPAAPPEAAAPPDAGRRYIRSLTDAEKSEMLLRVLEGDAHAGTDLRAGLRAKLATSARVDPAPRRTVADLHARTAEVRQARERAEAEAAAKAKRRQEEAARKAQRLRVDALAQRGDDVWAEIEAEIERRNAGGYNRAAEMLADLQIVAREAGTAAAFARRMEGIRGRHASKKRFMERIEGIG
jgi:antitoxin component of MazEF toxin-antitoxin module